VGDEKEGGWKERKYGRGEATVNPKEFQTRGSRAGMENPQTKKGTRNKEQGGQKLDSNSKGGMETRDENEERAE